MDIQQKNCSDRRRQKKVSLLCAVLTAVFFVSLPFGEVFAWEDAADFSDSCAPPTYHDTSDGEADGIEAPFLVLDRSYSMDSLGGACSDTCGDGSTNCSMWEIAVCSIDAAVAAYENELQFGFGFFPEGDNSERYEHPDCDGANAEGSGGDCYASYDVEFDYGNHDAIMDVILSDGNRGGQGTPTTDALIMMRDVLQNAALEAGGVLVTDGDPEDNDRAIDAACDARDAGTTNYIVGIGTETDKDYNDKMAAAAGTGCCGPNAEEGCPGGTGADAEVDPCTESVSGSDCYGSYLAYNEEEFQAVLMEISEEMMECTFTVDDDHWDDVPDDPNVGRVRYDSTHTSPGEYVEIPHVSESGGGTNRYEACPDPGEFCMPGGRCMQMEENYACNFNPPDQCLQAFGGTSRCHAKEGCIEEATCNGYDSECPDGFCWHNACRNNSNGADALDDDQRCSDHSDCNSDYACHDGLCRQTQNEWCPYDDYQDGTWDCPDSNHTCHPYAGCISDDIGDPYCPNGDDDCADGEFCWEGMCVDDSESCDPDDEGGWYFANEDNNLIGLTDDYCEQLGDDGGSRHITEIETKLACTCYSKYEGHACSIFGEGDMPDPGNIPSGCPAGAFECNGQHPEDDRECCVTCEATEGGVSNPDGDCPFYCPDDMASVPCDPDCLVVWNHIEERVVYVCDDEYAEPEDFATVSRCNVGTGECVEGIVECIAGADLSPMPETCDGLDNSCDGKVDNIEESWENWRNCDGPMWGSGGEYRSECEDFDGDKEIAGYTPAAPAGAACYEHEEDGPYGCNCVDTGESEHRGQGLTYEDEFEAYLEAYESREDCACTPAMEW